MFFLNLKKNEKYVFSNTGFGRHLVAYMVPWSHPSPGPNGILIDSAVLQGSIVCPTDKLTSKHTDRETYHICSNSQQNDNDDDDDDQWMYTGGARCARYAVSERQQGCG